MTQLRFDFSKAVRPIKAMNAVNNGPVGSKEHGVKGNFDDYAAARIPYARNHDASYFIGYGGEHAVDVHRIFKNFDADENDPSSYIFEPTDRCVLDTFEAGTKVFYRLGASIEHGYKYGTRAPKDPHKWARICEHIIRHYTEGWANGFKLDIEYWEIWNEPDCLSPDGSSPCWQGTPEQFKELFFVTAKHLKERFPHLKIGGPAICNLWGDLDRLIPKFIEHGIRLDFYSFHWYGCDMQSFLETIKKGREQANKYFGEQAETILNEYNYVSGWSREEMRKSVQIEQSLKGAAFIATIMAAAQNSGMLDMLMYYDARPFSMNGMFAPMTLEKLKTYYTISSFSHLLDLGTQVEGESADGIYSVAAADMKGNGALLLSHYDNNDDTAEKEVRLVFNGFNDKVKATFYLLDEKHDMQVVREEIFEATQTAICVSMPVFTTYLIKFEAIKD